MRSMLRIFLAISVTTAIAGCGDDATVKAIGDALSGATDDAQVAVDSADDVTTAQDVTITTNDTAADADALAPSVDASATGDAQADAAPDVAPGSDAVSIDDADASDALAGSDVTADDATDAATDAAATDAAVADAPDAAGSDAVADDVDGADAPDTWGPCSSGVSCEDGDPCTIDLCWSLSCQHFAITACAGPLTPCDAQHACSSGVCDLTRNACVPCIAASDCGPGHACAQDACLPAVACKSDLTCKGSGQVCNKVDGICADCVIDGDCGKGDQCHVGLCAAAIACVTSKDCPAVCDLQGGFCVDCVDSTDCVNGQACNPGHQCVPVTCQQTTCQGGAAFACNTGGWSYGAGIVCEDGNVCTSDACADGSGCKSVPNTLACSDNNACTVNDTCGSGACAGAFIDCNDKNPCTADSCDPTTGCQHDAAIGPCDDGSACTVADQCVGTACTGKPVDCNDGAICTTDSCAPDIGCRNLPADVTACDDGDPCTSGTQCLDGKCQGGTALNCDDGLACTADGCDAKTGCVHKALDGATCSDGDACTGNDVCKGSACVGQSLVCSDGKVCTDDGCDPKSGCTFSVNSAPCNDGNACSSPDVCSGGTCQGGSLVDCNDGNPCTLDGCDGKGGCTHSAVADKTACDDGDPCTLADTCQTGLCKGASIDCNDTNDCTVDSCTGGTCKHVNIVGTCDDKNGCTVGDTCVAGTCAPGKAVDCGADSGGCGGGTCKSTGSSTFACSAIAKPDGTPCEADQDGCTVNDACKLGACLPGKARDCSASTSTDGCQIGVCQSLSNTTNTCTTQAAVAGTSCNADANGCTAGDTCNQNGACVPGPMIDCNADPASCFTGACQSTGNATYACASGAAKGDGTACNADNNACTLDACKAGKCLVGAAPDCSSVTDNCDGGACKSADWTQYTCVPVPITCDDGNPCTNNACQLPGGCVFTPNSASCNDANVCTLSDTCSGGKCVGGMPAMCDDKNACTSDTCDATKGCLATAISCDDTDPCTVDTCDTKSGCLHTALPNCVTVSVPYVEPFNCASSTGGSGAVGWTLGQTVEPNLGWAVDGTAATPGFLSPSCSLNFNNGTDFACVNAVDASAVSPVILTANLPTGSHLALRFFNNGAYENLPYDSMSVEITTDSGVNWKPLLNIPAPASLAWTLQTVDLTPYVGKALQVRFHFLTTDCIANDTVGGFIDDFAIYTTSCAATATCDDKNSCTTDACDKLSGQCTFTALVGTACTDGNSCTTGDVFKNGVCAGTPGNCDDANACTLDSCDAGTGKCVHLAPISATTCNDNNPCTTNDACSGTTCVGGVSPCTDNNACTQDFCANGGGAPTCSYKPLADLTPCNDGNTCTAPDFCMAGACTGVDVCGYQSVFSDTFACASITGWTLQGVGKTALAWAIDATPATPGYYSASCSLNFNDGTTYGSVVPAVASATSPSFGVPATATACKLSLYSWSDIGFFNQETRTVALVDSVSGLDLTTFDMAAVADKGVWTQVQVNCMAGIGHKVAVQLRFSDAAGPLPVTPNGAGWFVDDVNVTVGVP